MTARQQEALWISIAIAVDVYFLLMFMLRPTEEN